MDELIEKALLARKAWFELAGSSDAVRKKALESMAQAIIENKEKILEANSLDVKKFKEENPEDPIIDRLILNEKRLISAAEGLKKISQLPDPIGEIVEGWTTGHGLKIQKVRVPIGVIGVIYESRPNVTIDISGLALKSGNAVILRGGSEAINSNKIIAEILRESIKDYISKEVIQIIENTDRSVVERMLKLNGYLDLLIPRGSSSFIDYVRKNALVPVIETGAGNNHIFVNYDADLDMATKIIINAKVQRPAVCNAVRKVLIHKDIAEKYIPMLVSELKKYGVTIKGDDAVLRISPDVIPANESDWDKEYMDLTLSIKVVNSVQEAVEHINKHGTKHSEAIITNSLKDAQYFTWNVDAACTYVNASIRFTDGEQFGFGAEVGISTQKLHARGPMGIRELTTTKYIIYGEGQIREI
ncbi:MAG: glutamate-5-semialdehyde dehydrogenase [Nitrososphaeria archaeon]|nr:glutamate-5-semialdehyde dehydrogenase [Conexivisphaerales archaeon]